MKSLKNIRGCIITFPISRSGNVPLSNLVEILRRLCSDLSVVTGNEGYEFIKKNKDVTSYCVNHRTGSNWITRAARYVWTQIKISGLLFKIRGKTDFYLLFIGSEGLLIPVLCARLMNKKVFLAPADYTIHRQKDALSVILSYLTGFTRFLSDAIIVPSEEIAVASKLERYRPKIVIAQEHFLDLEDFRIIKRLDERKNVVGYVGRLSEEKGVINYVEAIPKISWTGENIEYLIAGEGELKEGIEAFVKDNGLGVKVRMTGWIPHETLPEFLNGLKLLVIPSYNETGPQIALEAMACGTPVLASRAGIIPRVIKDGETGFILPSNSPECIARNVERVLCYPDLQGVAGRARSLVVGGYTFDAAVERYKEILKKL